MLVEKVKEFISNDYVDHDEDKHQDYEEDDAGDEGETSMCITDRADAASCSRDGV